MDIDILFKGKTSNNIFTKVNDGWYLAPSDQDTFKYVLLNIKQECPDGLNGVIIKVRNFKYNDAIQLWASVNIDKIIAALNPGGDNITNWLSDKLDTVGNDSTNVIEATKNMGAWVDDIDMSLVIDGWKDHKVTSKDDYKTILHVIQLGLADNNILSTADAMEIVKQYNKLSNSITCAFSTASAQGIIDIAKENFDCSVHVIMDTNDIEDLSVTCIPKEARETLWKILVKNRGKIKTISFNIDTNSNDIEIFKIERYDDTKGLLYLEGVIIYDCEIENAELIDCIMYKSKFTHCTFKKCKTLGVRVRLKDCKDYKEELEGQYNIIKDDNDNNEQSE